MKRIFSIAISFGFALSVQAQSNLDSLTYDGLTNGLNDYRANCWQFGAMSVVTDATVISGSGSMRTNALTNPNGGACWVRTPWILPGSGNITMKMKHTTTNGTWRGIKVRFAPFDNSAPNKVGAFISDSFETRYTINSSLYDVSFALPSSVANSSTPYIVMISFVGEGGTNRMIVDNLNVPGTFYADPANGCVVLTPKAADADNDGVLDDDDDYPNNPRLAYNNPFPATGFSTVMFEDLWPSRGDYDFNDVVVDYSMNRITDGKNRVAEVRATVVLRAIGASFSNGFAFQIDGLNPNRVVSVSGNKIFGSVHSFNANGTEANQSNAVFVAFDNAFRAIGAQSTGGGINVTPRGQTAPYDTIRMVIVMDTTSGNSTSLSEFSFQNFNPFIIVNQTRGIEVHLIDKTPSSLVNSSLLGTGNDNSNPSTGKYYRTSENLPFAIQTVASIPHMQEKVDLLQGYTKLAEWVSSSGALFADWYLDSPGYRNNEKLY